MRNVYLTLAIALLCGPKGIAQADSSSLHALYGEPVLERFAATPQIELLVNYGIDRKTCEILIQPASMSILPTEKRFGPMMDEIVVSQILEDVSPTVTRGKAGLSYVTKSGCNELSVEEFGSRPCLCVSSGDYTKRPNCLLIGCIQLVAATPSSRTFLLKDGVYERRKAVETVCWAEG